MTSHALPLAPPDRGRRALLAACLLLGVADLAFLDGVVLPRVLSSQVERTEPAPAPAPAAVAVAAAPAPAPAPVAVAAAPAPEPAPVAVAAAPAPAPEPEAPPPEAPAPTLALTIQFDTGEAVLDPRARAAVASLAARVDGHRGWSLAVEGHADARGDAAVNERLSQERAQVVARRLEKLGLPAARVQLAAFGSTRPVAEGDGPAALRRNRRVEILIVRGAP